MSCSVRRVLGGDWMTVCKPEPNHKETEHKAKKAKPVKVKPAEDHADSSYKTVEPTGYHSII